ncbi:MAG: SPFH domain-containing protein [Stigonema ocellatum SAG 48.90 = DSM 106950]|nr:SPFH domain-containing protein [Stigonema ocellatum SAG 48.90 = DSM 106950]
MSIQLSATNQPQRQYAQPGGIRVSLGSPIRFIAGIILAAFWTGLTISFLGFPSASNAGTIVLFIGIALICILVRGIRVAAQWERGVVLRLGRLAGLRGPGVFYIIPGLESVLFIDKRLQTLDIPNQRAITKDNVPVQIDGALFFLVRDPSRAVVEVQDYRFATSQYAQAALRDVVGGLSLDELLAEREQIQESIRNILEQRTQSLGIHVDSIRLLDVDVPEDLKRMMSRQASAEREKRATITKAEGDKLAALNLADAAATMLLSPGAMQLRTLQTIDGLGTSPSNTVIMLPVELSELMKGLGKGNTDPTAFEQMGIARKCGKCGNALVAEAHFCSKCGEKITR